jgi:hypothetical protein
MPAEESIGLEAREAFLAMLDLADEDAESVREE